MTFAGKSIINGSNQVVYLAFFQIFFQIIKVRVIKLKTKKCKAIRLGIYEDEDETKKKKLSLSIWSTTIRSLGMGRSTCNGSDRT